MLLYLSSFVRAVRLGAPVRRGVVRRGPLCGAEWSRVEPSRAEPSFEPPTDRGVKVLEHFIGPEL